MKQLITTLLILLIIAQSAHAQNSILWEKSYGGTKNDMPARIIKHSKEGFVILGYSASDDFDVSKQNGGSDFWFLRLDDFGNIVWDKSIGSSKFDNPASILETSDGGLFMIGSVSYGDKDVSNFAGYSDIWAVKLNNSGTIIWESSLGGTDDDKSFDAIQTNDGGFIIAGYTNSNDGQVTGFHGSGDAWILKLDKHGALEWQKCLGGSNNIEAVHAVIQKKDGNYLLAGRAGSTDGDVTTKLGNNTLSDVWVLLLSQKGELLWQKCYGGSVWEEAVDIIEGNNGNYIVAGFSNSNDIDLIDNKGLNDCWVFEINDTGKIIWQKNYGGSHDDRINQIISCKEGGYAFFGNTKSNNSGDVSKNHSSFNTGDMWFVKIDDTGAIQMEQNFGCKYIDVGKDLIQLADTSYVITGHSTEPTGDVTKSNGGRDFWVAQFRIGSPVAVENIPTSSKTKIYPTTFNNILQVDSPNPISEITIHNIDGKIIFKSQKADKHHKLSLGYLSSGTYIINFNENGHVYSKKIIKH